MSARTTPTSTLRRHLLPGESLTVEVELRATDASSAQPVLDIEIGDRHGNRIYHVDTDGLGRPLAPLTGERTVRIDIADIRLLDGQFPISLKLSDRGTGAVVDWREAAASFEVQNDGRADGTVAFDVTVE